MAQIIDGKKVSSELLKNLKTKIDKLDKKPALAVILANDNPASKIYVSSKEKHAITLGIKSCIYKFDKNDAYTNRVMNNCLNNINKIKQVFKERKVNIEFKNGWEII